MSILQVVSIIGDVSRSCEYIRACSHGAEGVCILEVSIIGGVYYRGVYHRVCL